MKKIVLAVVAIAAVAVIAYKGISSRQAASEQRTSAVTADTKREGAQDRQTLYLFHDPSDQDEGCRRVYAFADQAERELSGRVEVRRPDVGREKELMARYQVRVLPTILLVSADGRVAERFEGEDSDTVKRLESTMARLKTAQ
jgi:hypothetical protein